MTQSPPTRTPTMGPTSLATLVVAALAAAALSWLGISRFYGEIPRLTWLPVVTLVALAAIEGYSAFATKARIDRRPGRTPVDPLLVARLVVLAKASSLAAAIFAGLYGGAAVWLMLERQLAVAAADLPVAAGGLAASLALGVAALLLERACRVPRPPDKPDEGDADPGR
ncbi:MAG TPA: DUF3180 domain-containing protein [Micromonosporaceae bacterium]|nr:DUF3180 domain-containing protein [Micromonosporaceae bacterium]